MLSKEEKINLLLLVYQKFFNPQIIADGQVGREATKAVYRRRQTPQSLNADENNLLILAHKAAGTNDHLVADGVAGDQLFVAEDNFLGLGNLDVLAEHQ